MLSNTDVAFFKKTVNKVKKETAKEITACCPLCGDTKYRCHLYDSKYDIGLVYCYNAGCEASEAPIKMETFLRLANGDVSGYKSATLGYKIDQIKTEKSLQDVLDEVKAKKIPKTLEKEIPKVLLDRFKKCKENKECTEYIKSRKIEVQEDWLFSIDDFFTYNEKSVYLKDYLIIPIHNHVGKYKGFYSRSIREKRFSTFLLPDTEKIWIQDWSKPPSHIFEGIFDACSTEVSNPAAMLGADISDDYLRTLSKDTVFVFDNDPTGTKKAIKYAKLGFKIFVWPERKEKDTNEMLTGGYSKKEITKMINENVFKGYNAEVRLRMKPK